jgi:hypothetical protein
MTGTIGHCATIREPQGATLSLVMRASRQS